MFQWLKKTALWIVAVPTLAFVMGVASNQVVLMANHDTFPVMINDAKMFRHVQTCVADAAEAQDEQAAEICLAMAQHGYIDDTHVVMTPKTHLNFLADVFDFGPMGIWSVGDIAIELGGAGMGLMWPIWFFVAVGKLCKKEN